MIRIKSLKYFVIVILNNQVMEGMNLKKSAVIINIEEIFDYSNRWLYLPSKCIQTYNNDI